MPSSAAPRGSSRRFMWLAIAIVAAAAHYSGGWYRFAGQKDAPHARTVADLNAGGDRADCTNRSIRGYPFRVGLFCDEASFAAADGSASVTATGLRSAANVYQPFRIVGELDRIAVSAAHPAAGPG